MKFQPSTFDIFGILPACHSPARAYNDPKLTHCANRTHEGRAILRYATRNLRVKKLRSSLAVFGLSISILQIVTLLGMSGGLKELVASTFEMVDGMIVLNKDFLSPMMSQVDRNLGKRIEGTPGVVGVLPEVWNLAWRVEGQQPFKRGLMTGLVLVGYDPAARQKLTQGGFFEQRLTAGKHFEGDRQILLSETVAKDYQKTVGDSIDVMGVDYAITGIFRSNSVLTENLLVVSEASARKHKNLAPQQVSIFFVEIDPKFQDKVVADSIEARLKDVRLDAMTKDEANVELTWAFRRLDIFILFVSLFSITVGALGVLNTMLMSVLERTEEFGILRATGWDKGDVTKLVLMESIVLGLIGGFIGCAGGYVLVRIGGVLLEITPVTGPALLLGSFALAVVLGVAGGLYPARRAGRMSPMDAIRSG